MTASQQRKPPEAYFRHEDYELLSVMAFGYMDSGHYQKALPLYRTMAEKDPEQGPRWRLGAAFCFFAMGKKEKSLEMLKNGKVFSRALLPSYHFLKKCLTRSSARG